MLTCSKHNIRFGVEFIANRDPKNDAMSARSNPIMKRPACDRAPSCVRNRAYGNKAVT
jgi:hypothetical protein